MLCSTQSFRVPGSSHLLAPSNSYRFLELALASWRLGKRKGLDGLHTTCVHIHWPGIRSHTELAGAQLCAYEEEERLGIGGHQWSLPHAPQLREVKTGTGFPDFWNLCSKTEGPVCSRLFCQPTASAEPSPGSVVPWRWWAPQLLGGGLSSHKARAMV